MPTMLSLRIICTLALGIMMFVVGSATAVQAQQNVQRPQNNNEWVVDQTNSLTPDAIAHLNDLCNEINAKGQAEVVVVLVRTTGGRDYKQYSLDLFNHWGVGDATNDNGIMIFIAKQDRTARIVLGEGIDTAGHQRIAQQIFDQAMAPELRAGNFAACTYKAAFSCGEQILGLQDLNSPADLPTVAVAIPRNAEPTTPLTPTTPRATNPIRSGGTTVAPGPTANPVTANPRPNANRVRPAQNHGRAGPKRPNPLVPILWIAGGGMGLGGLALIGGRHLLKSRERSCPKCEAELVLLSEAVDDEFLEGGELVEERIGSVNYDAWACFTCEDVIKIRHGTFLTRYSKCPTCRRQTKSKIKHTLVRATRRRGGVVKVIESCQNCDYHNQYTYRTPRLPDHNSNSSSGFGSGSSSRSRSSSRSSRSSSGGRTFGGGRSRGGGGGGRW